MVTIGGCFMKKSSNEHDKRYTICSHCVNRYTLVVKIESITEIERLKTEEQDLLKFIKSAFNTLPDDDKYTTSSRKRSRNNLFLSLVCY